MVPEVYSIMPPWSLLESSSVMSRLLPELCILFSTSWSFKGFSNPSFSTSSALDLNLFDASNSDASLFSKMYRSSLAGNPGERGTAMLLLPKIDSSVTSFVSLGQLSPRRACRTYIVIAVLYQKGKSLPIYCLRANRVAQIFLRLLNILEQSAVCKTPSGSGMFNGGSVRVMARDGLEDWQSWKSGDHFTAVGYPCNRRPRMEEGRVVLNVPHMAEEHAGGPKAHEPWPSNTGVLAVRSSTRRGDADSLGIRVNLTVARLTNLCSNHTLEISIVLERISLLVCT